MAHVPTPDRSSAARAARRAEAKRVDRIGWRLAGVGWEFSSQVLAGVLIGWGIDWYFEVKPWGIVGGAAAGLAVGSLQFIRGAAKLNREMGPVSRPPEGWKPVEERTDAADPAEADDAAPTDRDHGEPRR